MFNLKTKYGEVKIFTDIIEEQAVGQIIEMANSPLGEDSHIRIMPDVHAGKGCTIGTTMKITDKVCPNLVGVDIGCGVMAAKISTPLSIEDYHKLDIFCKENIFSGRNVRFRPLVEKGDINLLHLHCYKKLRNMQHLRSSMGTLGGGNHYIELDKTLDGIHWLVVHTGSRNLGKQVADIYQQEAEKQLTSNYRKAVKETIDYYNAIGHPELIEGKLKEIRKMPKTGLEYLEGEGLENYLDDMGICQAWAQQNRLEILTEIIAGLGWSSDYFVESIHNYIDLEKGILRKGAISAQKDEDCLIPLNMRDGILICKGLGKEDWNYSAPHGAGRILSRSAAKKEIDLEAFRDSMKDIVSSSVCEATLDESPFAYKNSASIIENIKDTVRIIDHAYPVFNYKATE